MTRRTFKHLKNITWQEFVDSKVSDIETWPYCPTGTLRKPTETDPKKTNGIIKFQEEDWRTVKDFLTQFSEKQKMGLSWVFAAFIAVIGNLAVNFAFAFPVAERNLFWAFFCLGIVIVLISLYLKFLP